MSMARAAARFLYENLRHANGLPVECVIADTCIGGVAEAAQCAEKFSREGVGLSMRVDRIDRLDDNSLLLIDYKTGRTSIRDWLGERK